MCGAIQSTLRGYHSVHWGGGGGGGGGGVSSLVGYPEYTGGCSVHWRAIMMLCGSLEYTGCCSVHWGKPNETLFSTMHFHEYLQCTPDSPSP